MSAGSSAAQLAAGSAARASKSASSGTARTGPSKPAGRDQLEVAGVGHDGARLDRLHPRAQVGGPQLLGAGLGHGAEPPAGEHRVGPLGPVADHGHHHIAAGDAALRQGAGEPRRAVGHLPERDLAALPVRGDRDERQARRVGGVDDVCDEAHSGGDQRSPRLSRSSPSQAKSMAISTICSRGASGCRVHQFAIDCVPPTSISARSRSARSLLGAVELAGAGILRDQHRDLGGHLLEHPVDHGCRLRVGDVPEEHAPRVAALLDEREEGVEADGEPRRPRLELHAHERRADALGELAGVAARSDPRRAPAWRRSARR